MKRAKRRKRSAERKEERRERTERRGKRGGGRVPYLMHDTIGTAAPSRIRRKASQHHGHLLTPLISTGASASSPSGLGEPISLKLSGQSQSGTRRLGSCASEKHPAWMVRTNLQPLNGKCFPCSVLRSTAVLAVAALTSIGSRRRHASCCQTLVSLNAGLGRVMPPSLQCCVCGWCIECVSAAAVSEEPLREKQDERLTRACHREGEDVGASAFITAA